MRAVRAPLPRSGRLPRRPAAAALLALAGLVLACGDSTGPGSSAFTATVTGATNKSYSGEALALADGPNGFGVLLESAATTGPDQLEIFIFRDDGTVPSPGTYDIVWGSTGTEDFSAFATMGYGEPDQRTCSTAEGTITFTTASSSRVVGTFEFSMTCLQTENEEAVPEEASVEGTFEAPAAVRL